MVIVRLSCGLGNQMFQYAFGRSLAILNQTELKLDLTHYREFEGRSFALDIFNINAGVASVDAIVSISGCTPGTRKKGLCKHLDRFLRFLNPKDHRRIIRERHFHFDPHALEVRGNIYIMEGYWQSPRYFEAISDIIRKEFSFKNPPDTRNARLLEEMAATESVAVHVRRGDYVGHSRFDHEGILAYYRKCAEELSSTVKEPLFYVFSDDPIWTRANLTLKGDVVFVDHNCGMQDHEDLRLMSGCKHQIITNSTFSWWGAWLNVYPRKLVYVPRPWYKGTGRDCRDIAPKLWKRMTLDDDPPKCR